MGACSSAYPVDALVAAPATDASGEPELEPDEFEDARRDEPRLDAGKKADAKPNKRDACVPVTCASLGKSCGPADDGCGRRLACGACGVGETCGALSPGVCGPTPCTAESDGDFCARSARQCDSFSGTDNCGQARTASCGSCASWQTCATSLCRAPVDRTTCRGPAAVSGSFNGVTPKTTVGATATSTDPATGNRYLGLVLEDKPPSLLTLGDHLMALYFQPVTGELSYSGTTSNVFCSLIQVSSGGSGLTQLARTPSCSIVLSKLALASAANVCDGIAEGTFSVTFPNAQVVTGSFNLPVDVAASQLVPACRPVGAACTTHAQCCGSSCSPVGLGCQ